MPTYSSFGSRLHQRGTLAVLGLLVGCAHGPRTKPGGTRDEPERYLEAQLLGRHAGELDARTADGGMLYHAGFDATHMVALRTPFETLKQHCEHSSGTFVPAGPARHSAAALVNSTTPDDVRIALASADGHGVFGAFRCLSKRPTWTAHIEPTELLAAPSGTFRLQLFVKAFVGSDLSVLANANAATPPATTSANATPAAPPSAQPTAAGPAPTSAATPPPVAPPPLSPLDPQPLGPQRSSDELLADPAPFGLHLGSDTQATLATTLQLDPKPGNCKSPAPRPKLPAAVSGTATAKAGAETASLPKPVLAGLSSAWSAAATGGLPEQCWKPSNTQATEVRASFADVGQGQVLGGFEVRYPANAFDWLTKAFQHAWGQPDEEGDRPTAHAWSWLHTSVLLYHVNDSADQDVIVQALHRPTLERARLPAGSPARKQAALPRVASPWQLQLGHEPAQAAQAKLEAAGFAIAANGCSDGGPYAAPVLTRACPLRGRMDGLHSASVTIVDLGDGRPRLASLEYQFDKQVLAETQRELRSQYGEPLAGKNGSSMFWTGPVVVVIEPASDGFALRYLHGRLTQLFANASAKNRAGEKAHQKRGL